MGQLWLHTRYILINYATDQDRNTELILCDIQKFLFEDQLYTVYTNIAMHGDDLSIK